MKTLSWIHLAVLLQWTVARRSLTPVRNAHFRQTTRSNTASLASQTRYHQSSALPINAYNNKRRSPDSLSSSKHNVILCSSPVSASRSIPATLLRGAFLRIASDLSGGTAFESIKCRVSATRETAWEALHNTVSNGGLGALWTGTPSRTVEGALVGSVFMLASTITKTQIKTLMGAGPTSAALAGGLIGGIAQAFVMTPAGMVFTSLNVNRGKPGHENDTAWSVTRRIVQEQGVWGMYAGFKPMALRQASNWASRAGLTEIARSVLNLQQYGLWGEIGSGILGGLGSCWNTPIETVRVMTQRDLGRGLPTKTIQGYWGEIIERDGYPGLFRGITPRAFQAIWQTCFMVVVPNVMGI